MSTASHLAPAAAPGAAATSPQLPAAAWRDLAAQLQGELIRPEHADYDDARRVWNGMVDRYPAAIVRCAAVADVVAAVNFARDQGLLLAVRGGGHHVAGHGTCDGGLVIDLSPLRGIECDLTRRVVAVQGGATWAEVDAVTQRYGLATPGGLFSQTGVAGLTLSGGYGWLRNRWGLSCDNLVAAEVVTATGDVIWANAQAHPDLLWALRGGGGNFGVVTTFVYQLHPLGPEVAFAFVLHDAAGDRLAEVLRRFRDYSLAAPDEVSSLAAVGVVPPTEAYPAELHGRPFVLLGGLYAGPAEEGMSVLAPLEAAGTPLINASGIQRYTDVQQMFDHDYPAGARYYWKSLHVSGLDDALIETVAAHARQQPSPYSTIDIWHVGGAVRRVTADRSAFHGRQAPFMVNAEANWHAPGDDAANQAWVAALHADLARFGDGSRYLNFAGFQEEGAALMAQSFGPHYARLAAVKRGYDPQNLFRLNANIVPAA